MTKVKDGPCSGLRVRVVDDLATNVKLAVALLRRLVAAPPAVAANGLQAEAAVKEPGPFDVILMDVQARTPLSA